MSDGRPHILFAWELGANYGHASNIAEVGRRLIEHARVTVVAKDPVSFRQIAPDLDVTLLQAPRAQPRPPPAPDDFGVSYADDLRHVGWDDGAELAALVETWNGLLDMARPDLVAFQAAPTAALACHGRDVKRAFFGYGYDLPPRVDPLPPFFHWSDQAQDAVAAKERAVLETANAALSALGRPRMDRFQDMLAVDGYLIGSFPEIDPYGPRTQFGEDRPTYYGQLSTTNVGQELDWRADSGKRLFAYLRPTHDSTKLALEALPRLPPEWDCILSIPGAPADVQAKASRPNIRIVDGPARLDRLLKDCDICMSHSGNGVVAAFLAAGVPQVVLPTQAEQVMTARALAQNQLSIGLVGQFGATEIVNAIQRIASLPQMRQKARAVAKRLKRDNLLEPDKRIAQALIRLI